ncbi:MAG: hypothetical protein K2X27_12815 [Candidatus Obscuribacterales bacterium]|nr:hypothetical protein [Candidatus Obscuribacterales bacterium]
MEFYKIFDRFFSRDGAKVLRKDMPNVTLAKMRLASHPDAKACILKKLSRHACESIVARVAENANTEVDVLESLLKHPDPNVRIAITENANAPVRILLLLAADQNVDVRYSLSENHNIPPSVLAVLSEDENPYVADRAARTLRRVENAGSSKNFVWFPFVAKSQKQDMG